MKKAIKRIRKVFRKPAEQRYVAAVMKKIEDGRGHSTLGPDIRDEPYTRAKAERWCNQMIDLGLKSDHLCVEYGCGSLWAAEPIIRFLDAGRYFGLDITDQFYAFGRERLSDLVHEKQVRFAVIAEPTLRKIAALQPDFLFSRKVLPHVPDEALPRYLANVCSLLAPKTIAALDNTPVINDDGSVTGRRHTAEAMQALLPKGFEITQSRYAAVLRRRA